MVADSAAVADLVADSAVEAGVEADQVEAAADSADGFADRVDILGVPLDLVDGPVVHSTFERTLAGSQDKLLHVVTLNPEYVVAARSNQAFRAAINRAKLVVADGVGVRLAAWLLHGQKAGSIERVTGVDLVEWLLVDRAAVDSRVFVLGGPNIRPYGDLRYPTSRIVGSWSGGTPHSRLDAESLRRIAHSDANILLVAYGAPDQVVWIDRNQYRLTQTGVKVAIGVGGAIDFWCGLVPRAPKFIRRLGLEWLYRLVRQPWRWRRQLALPRFVALVVRERVTQMFR
jgi:N-acetylglucosaminyldiphosphoundecaprenol N-acetyl-beta-D-mannosaminyltransferase